MADHDSIQSFGEIIKPTFRDRLLHKGLARGLIWRAGTLPPGAPRFPSSLTEDLLEYGYAVLGIALRLRKQSANGPSDDTLRLGFLAAGDAIEAALHHGSQRSDRSFHLLTAAVAFHLAGYSPRAYSLLPLVSAPDRENYAPPEQVLANLLGRRLDRMFSTSVKWLRDPQNGDRYVSQRLERHLAPSTSKTDDGRPIAPSDVDSAYMEAVNTVLTTEIMRGLGVFHHALQTGDRQSATHAKRQLDDVAGTGSELHFVPHWWTATLAAHLVDDLWNHSLHMRLPKLLAGLSNAENWTTLRRRYIHRLRQQRIAALELWPSQLEALERALDPGDDLVVALPTSSGKTRIAELCMLRCLVEDHRVVYVTPLRALSAQVERDFRSTLSPLGFSVSSLYGAASVQLGDTKTLHTADVVVATPEKLDFASRANPAILDDVGLLVLDEGHMFGPDERGVRYEALIQGLLRRDDAPARRLVCLSALFPSPEELRDLVMWIRRDAPGDPVHSTWRPTRQRFGTLTWFGGFARLEFNVEEESPFVPRFVTSVDPPVGSGRRTRFPRNKNELTLRAAWEFIERRKNVLIYCPLKKSVGTLGRLAMECMDRGLLGPLDSTLPDVDVAIEVGTEWLGADHPAVRGLRYGLVLHHGSLPHPFRQEIEKIIRTDACSLCVASPTLAQGLNLACSVILIPSVMRGMEPIKGKELANVAGRAGRAFVDTDGLIVNVVWPKDERDRKRKARQWRNVVANARAPAIRSGLLLLLDRMSAHIRAVAQAKRFGGRRSHDELTWGFVQAPSASYYDAAWKWGRDLASLDSAILSFVDSDVVEEGALQELESAIEGSLFARHLATTIGAERSRIVELLRKRTETIWREAGKAQRRGVYACGVGLVTGRAIDADLSDLVTLILRVEARRDPGSDSEAVDAVVAFAEWTLGVPPFAPHKEMPGDWQKALRLWMRGRPASEVVRVCGGTAWDTVQEVFVYRVPWGMEAVRSYGLEVAFEAAAHITGIGALSVESGSLNRAVICMLRAGLGSRNAAIAAAESTGADFEDEGGMQTWLRSAAVRAKTADSTWPTPESHLAWRKFVERGNGHGIGAWKETSEVVALDWLEDALAPGRAVVLDRAGTSGKETTVLTTDYREVGVVRGALQRSLKSVTSARVGSCGRTIAIDYFGPLSA